MVLLSWGLILYFIYIFNLRSQRLVVRVIAGATGQQRKHTVTYRELHIFSCISAARTSLFETLSLKASIALLTVRWPKIQLRLCHKQMKKDKGIPIYAPEDVLKG